MKLWSFYFSIAAVIISILGLIHTIIYNLRYAKREIKNRQILLVLDLLEEINQSKINVFCGTVDKGGGEASGRSMDLNLWDISVLNDESFDKDFEDEQVLFRTGTNSLFNIEKYLNNPLLPKSIYDELTKYHERTFTINKSSMEQGKYVVLETGSFIESQFNRKADQKGVFNESYAVAFTSWLSFKKVSKRLKKAIKEYINSIKIGLANLRSDFDIQ